jgi:hypothetical protein
MGCTIILYNISDGSQPKAESYNYAIDMSCITRCVEYFPAEAVASHQLITVLSDQGSNCQPICY